MNCPLCNCEKTTTVDSRKTEADKTRRRRVCQRCKYRFSTVEISVDDYEALVDEAKKLRERFANVRALFMVEGL